MISIDFTFLIRSLVPPRLKRTELLSYLDAICKPLATIHAQFQQHFQDVKHELNWNGQVIVLEDLLNQTFDPAQRRVKIVDSQYTRQIYLFNNNENNESTHVFNIDESAPNLFLHNSTESTVDFIVTIPAGFLYNQHLFNALIKKYKLAGKTYQIEEI